MAANRVPGERAPKPEVEASAIRAAARGVPSAARTIVEHYQNSVHRFVWRMLGGRAADARVEELVQETFLRMFRGLPRFRVEGPARFSTWLLTIASRTTIDELRRRRPPVVSLVEAPEADSAHRPDALSERASLGRAIARAVDELSPDLRATFILRAYHDRTYPEMARSLGVDLGTVKSRLYRARHALMTALQEVHRDG